MRVCSLCTLAGAFFLQQLQEAPAVEAKANALAIEEKRSEEPKSVALAVEEVPAATTLAKVAR